MVGLVAEVLEADLLPYLPKVLQLLSRQIKDEAPLKVFEAIAESVGQIVLKMLPKIPAVQQMS